MEYRVHNVIVRIVKQSGFGPAGRRHESSETWSDASSKLYDTYFSESLFSSLIVLFYYILPFVTTKFQLLSPPYLDSSLHFQTWDTADMIESSRRRILDTLNSRYLYRRVVRFLMYNTTTCHHPCDDFIGGRGSTFMVAWCKSPQFWIFDGVNADLSASYM